MNKLILFTCLFITITSKCSTNEGVSKAADCKDKKLEGESGDVCCYVTYQNKTDKTTFKGCLPFNKTEVPKKVEEEKKTMIMFQLIVLQIGYF